MHSRAIKYSTLQACIDLRKVVFQQNVCLSLTQYECCCGHGKSTYLNKPWTFVQLWPQMKILSMCVLSEGYLQFNLQK